MVQRWIAICAISTLLFYYGSIEARACGDADQQRLLPIGRLPQAIVVIRLQGHRSWDSNFRTRYRYDVDLQIRQHSGELLRTVATRKRQDERAMGRVVAEFVQTARKMRGFRQLQTAWQYHCGFQLRCGPVTVVHRPQRRHQLVLQHKRQRLVRQVRYPAFFVKEAREWNLRDPRLARLRLGSLRAYTLGNDLLLVAHLARGSHLAYRGSVSPKLTRAPSCRTEAGCVPAEAFYHHGTGFDLLITIPRGR